jgi:hypothetical protein
MDDRRDTSTRDSIKGARVPLTLLAVHKTRVKSSRVDLHDGFLLPPALVVSYRHESSLIERGSSDASRRAASLVRDPSFIPRDLWDWTTIRQLTDSPTATFHSTGLSTHFTFCHS